MRRGYFKEISLSFERHFQSPVNQTNLQTLHFTFVVKRYDVALIRLYYWFDSSRKYKEGGFFIYVGCGSVLG
jgi:hypothetical protein